MRSRATGRLKIDPGSSWIEIDAGKGSVRRKKKTVHKTATSDDKKIGATLKKLGCTAIPDIQEVNMRGPGVDSARPGRRRFAPARRKRPTEKKTHHLPS